MALGAVQRPPPPPYCPGRSVRMLAAGRNHTVLLRSDGTAVACGADVLGRCRIPALEGEVTYTQVANELRMERAARAARASSSIEHDPRRAKLPCEQRRPITWLA